MDILRLFATGLIAGVVSPLLLSWLQHRVIWWRQKQLEWKWTVFQEAVEALSLWSRDALDPEWQRGAAGGQPSRQETRLRPETGAQLERSKGLVRAVFSADAWKAYEAVLHSRVSIDDIPNSDFEQKRVAAIVAMASDLGVLRQSDTKK